MLLEAAAAPALITTRRRNTHMTYVSSILMISSWPYKPLMAVEFLRNLFLCNRVSYISKGFFRIRRESCLVIRKSNCDGIQKMISSVRHRLEVLWHWPTAKPMCKKPQDHLQRRKNNSGVASLMFFLENDHEKRIIKNGLIKWKLQNRRVEIRAFLQKALKSLRQLGRNNESCPKGIRSFDFLKMSLKCHIKWMAPWWQTIPRSYWLLEVNHQLFLQRKTLPKNQLD